MPERAVLSTFRRFHAYHTAQVLERSNRLSSLYCADLARPGIDIGQHVRRYPLLGTGLSYLADRMNLAGLNGTFWDSFDSWVAGNLTAEFNHGARIFHGWNAFCLKSLAEAKRTGMRTFVERSCPHIVYQKAVVEEEMQACGRKPTIGRTDYFANTEAMIAEYETADYILTGSEYARKSFLAHGCPAHKVISIPLGANFEVREIERPNDARFRLLCVGTHPYRKGARYLIEAWRRLKLSHAELVLRTPIPEELRPQTEFPGITVLKPASRGKLIEEYRRATAFCLPSVDDGFGMVVLEAMAFGLPCIVSTNAGVSELIERGRDGIVFPVRDVDRLAEAILDLYRRPEKARWIGRNGSQLAARFSWDNYGDELLRCYEDPAGYKWRKDQALELGHGR